MQTRTILLLVLFWTMQAAAQAAFGWGSPGPECNTAQADKSKGGTGLTTEARP
jgi:hypothetical protein